MVASKDVVQQGSKDCEKNRTKIKNSIKALAIEGWRGGEEVNDERITTEKTRVDLGVDNQLKKK